jgi:hypothetical protein
MEAADSESTVVVEEANNEALPGRSMRVAAALRAKGGDEFAKPGNIIEVKFVKGESLSLTASRLLALMILTAGGDAWEDKPHRMRKADIRRGHKGNERITDMLQELHRTLFAVDDRSWRGKKATTLFSLISRSREETEDEGEAGWIEWEFTPDARKLIQASETYAVLGIPPEVYTDFAQLRRKVLEKAKAEIDQLAHFRVEWREIRQGRTVTEIEFRFEPKDAPALIATVDELERHSGGRKPRRDGTVETMTIIPAIPAQATMQGAAKAKELSFPSGSIRFGADELAAIARREGGGWDIDLIATGFRQQMGDRIEKVRGPKLLKAWTGFCEGWVTRRGRAT